MGGTFRAADLLPQTELVRYQARCLAFVDVHLNITARLQAVNTEYRLLPPAESRLTSPRLTHVHLERPPLPLGSDLDRLSTRPEVSCQLTWPSTGTQRGRESFSGNDSPHGKRVLRKRLPTPFPLRPTDRGRRRVFVGDVADGADVKCGRLHLRSRRDQSAAGGVRFDQRRLVADVSRRFRSSRSYRAKRKADAKGKRRQAAALQNDSRPLAAFTRRRQPQAYCAVTRINRRPS